MKKMLLGATAALVCGIGGYLACDTDDVDDSEGTSELMVIIKPKHDFPLRDNPSYKPTHVLVAVRAMHAHHVEHGWIDSKANVTIDLLAPEDDVPNLFTNRLLPEGMYDQLRFDVNLATVEVDHKWYPLEIPSSDESGLKVHTGFCLTDGETSSLELDWDIDKSLHYNDNRGYWLDPAIETFSPPTCADDLRTPPRS